MKLMDSEVAAIRARAASGTNSSALAAEFNISPRYARDIVAGTARRNVAPKKPAAAAVRPAVEAVVAERETSGAAEELAATLAVATAAALDAAMALGSAAALASVPRLAGELRCQLAELDPPESEQLRLKRMLAPLI